ncbi:hypothetical protein BVZ79_00152B, partial [Haemophilus influenzae]
KFMACKTKYELGRC